LTPSIDVEALVTTYLNQGETLTFNLQNLIRSLVVRASDYLSLINIV